MRQTCALAVAFGLWVVALAGQTQVTVDYDTFGKLDPQARIRLFNEVTAENRGALVREQIERWIEANRSQLTPQQLEIMKANAAWVTADKYRFPMDDQRKKEVADLEARTLAVFSREQVRQAMTIHGDYIPKKPTD